MDIIIKIRFGAFSLSLSKLEALFFYVSKVILRGFPRSGFRRVAYGGRHSGLKLISRADWVDGCGWVICYMEREDRYAEGQVK